MKVVLKKLPNTNPEEKQEMLQIEIDGNYKGLIVTNDRDTLDLLDLLFEEGMCMAKNGARYANPYSAEEYSYELTSLLRMEEKKTDDN